MKIEIKIPEVGESVQEGLLSQWYRQNGDRVRKGDILLLLETDKVTVEVAAEADGVLEILVREGETVSIGAVVGTIETDAEREKEVESAAAKVREGDASAKKPESPPPAFEPAGGRQPSVAPADRPIVSTSVRKLAEERGLDVSKIKPTGPGGRITRGDLIQYLEEAPDLVPRAVPSREMPGEARPAEEDAGGREPVARRAIEPSAGKIEEAVVRKPMSPIRQRIAERLLDARRNTAMLTTFNEIDMSRVQALRSQLRQAFQEKYGISLGIMSFFIKATVAALKEFPEVNAFIEGKDIVYHNYCHIGVAVGAERGLVVPVIRHAERLSFAEIERSISEFVRKIKENRLTISDLEGGTFSISNGGIYGSLMSTPILNTPQSGILGMHRIEDRPVAVEGQVVIRPMMYVALSYDHRIIDGREAVTFLRRIKECVENPERIMLEI